jgi:hypothetical protein
MDSKQFAMCILTSALLFRQHYDAILAAQAADHALHLEGGAATESDPADLPAEQDEDAWWDAYTEYVEKVGLRAFFNPTDSNMRCIASLNPGEAAFTLRGQDILASVLVRHWAMLAALGEDIRAKKLDEADRIAERMEEYTPQKWPD